MILHVVLYQPRSSATAEELAELTMALQVACREIPVIQQVRVGRTIDLQMGYMNRSVGQIVDYFAIFEFVDQLSLRAYLAHPQHVALAEAFWRVCEHTQLLDVEAVDPLTSEIIGQIR
jgi:hypothetical protein